MLFLEISVTTESDNLAQSEWTGAGIHQWPKKVEDNVFSRLWIRKRTKKNKVPIYGSPPKDKDPRRANILFSGENKG